MTRGQVILFGAAIVATGVVVVAVERRKTAASLATDDADEGLSFFDIIKRGPLRLMDDDVLSAAAGKLTQAAHGAWTRIKTRAEGFALGLSKREIDFRERAALADLQPVGEGADWQVWTPSPEVPDEPQSTRWIWLPFIGPVKLPPAV